MEKVIRKVTFEEAEQLDREYWAGKSVSEKWQVLTQLRIQFHGGQRITKVLQRVPHDR